jgi:hypothetical protein
MTQKRYRPRLLTVRAPRNTEQGARIRKLYRSFIAKLDVKDAGHVAMALTAAELTVAAENARAQLLAGDLDAESPTVRLENSARRARLDPNVVAQGEMPEQTQEQLIEELYAKR